MPPTTKIISGIPLTLFLDEFLGQNESMSVDLTIAQLIDIADKESPHLIHVQYKHLDTGKILARPLVWNYTKWLASEARRSKVREQSDYDRQRLHIFKEDVERVAKKLHILTRLPMERARFAAREMVLKGDWEFLKALGVDMKDIPPQRTDYFYSLDLNNITFDDSK